MTTGEKIRQRRNEMGMTQDQLAALVGISRSTLLRYENGAINGVPHTSLIPIAKALHTDPGYFLEEDVPRLTPAQVELVNSVEGLTEDRVRFYARMIKELEGRK